ncbi:MAG: NUDIX domain-containing protein [Ruminococcus sp.]|nr:NUDIX domain-containing protein [Ruminococcus sp.]
MDCTFKTEDGKFNFRVGAIIANGRKVLMARNPNESREFYYSVGGRVKVGESLEMAVLRELKEETGITCKIERMVAIHENFFVDDDGVKFHEISIFFLIKPNKELFNIENGQLTKDGPNNEYLEWIDLDNLDGKTIYPEFYKDLDFNSISETKHIVNREY